MTHAVLRASIVVIGDEILGGFVRDTNSGWLAGRLRTLGVPLDRIATVPDDPAAIDESLRAELARARPRVLLTSGGIGSTPDDVSLEAVAATLGRRLVVEPTIDARIGAAIARSAGQGAPVGKAQADSMRKMALVPEGAYLLGATASFAPGVAVDVDGGATGPWGATVVVLPGIPAELRRVTLDTVEPRLLRGRGRPVHVVEITHGYPESALNPVLQRLVADFADVHVGSYPGRECTVRLAGATARVEQAATAVRDYLAALDARPGSERQRAAWGRRWS
ncbi:MAG: molybdopterin-binding protein [Actinomycetota bacterium]|nr:molybdopterin-binding protein [Actinomycetota bacterium]